MTGPVDPDQLSWFRRWVERCDAGRLRDRALRYAPQGFARVVVVLHPGTEVAEQTRNGTPFRGDSSTEGSPSPGQKRRLEDLLVETSGARAPATLASYDPVPHAEPDPLLAHATRVSDPDHIDYLLVGGELAELTYTPWEERWPYEQPVTVLWPEDRRWWLHSDPDSSFTVLGCDDALAERLLAEPVLRAVEWPGREAA
jgi:hypothetical protein